MTTPTCTLTPDDVSIPSLRTILRGSGPRFAADAFGPVLAFYAVSRFAALPVAIGAATAVALASYARERRHHRPGLMAKVALAMVLSQAVIGLIGDSAVAYLAPHALHATAMGLAFLVSVAAGRPLAGVFAAEMIDLPQAARESDRFRQVFGRISLVWGVTLLGRAALRTVMLLTVGIEGYMAISVLTGGPLTAAVLVWSIGHGRRALRGRQPVPVVATTATATVPATASALA